MSAVPLRPSDAGAAAVTRGDIEAANERLAGIVRRTPVLEPGPASFGLDPSTRLTLKLELTQHTGSFKPRGAANRLLIEGGERPLAAASGGNHGQAVAWVARRFGRRATVFVPELASPVKQARIAAYGAELVVGGTAYADAQAACDAWVARSGALRIHPYDDPAVVAGQGTVALELAEQAPDLDTVLVAVGGGGLIGGIAAWYVGEPGVRVVAVEPERSCCLAAARAAGRPVPVEVAGLAADSLGARQLGEVPWSIVRDGVAQSLTVGDADIAAAQAALWETCRVAAEPGGATALAALCSGTYRPAVGERVGVVICGGNVQLGTLA